MSLALLLLLASGLALAIIAVLERRVEIGRMAAGLDELAGAREGKTHAARLQHPHVDLSRCIGCGICVAACPEEGVLEMIHGQAAVVHGARCVGHARCAEECPVGAIAVTLGDVEERRDIPALTERLESVKRPGLFLAGEVTGYALIRTAITHGTAVADEVADRIAAQANGRRAGAAAADGTADAPYDLVVVGAGPAGIACSLQAKARGLAFVTLEREELGGTVAKYPRRKLVMTQPVRLPLVGELRRTSFEKEELIELWTRIAREHDLPILTGHELAGVESVGDGLLRVDTSLGSVVGRNVCLALGRRGTPRKLDVPGEELTKVSYGLMDAAAYRRRRILVVGGGDSAVEAAVGLAEQPENAVTLSYRKDRFSRIKSRNERRLMEALEGGGLDLLLDSDVRSITPEAVDLALRRNGLVEEVHLPNDDVFVFAGGVAPFELLERSGVSFDPADRPPPTPLVEQGTGLLPALIGALALCLLAVGWSLALRGYYGLPPAERPDSPLHGVLRPSGGIGLGFGVAATLLILFNLTYLLRRSLRVPLRIGSLKAWMTSHVVTGVCALLAVTLHAALAPRNTAGGRAYLALVVLVLSGAVGRYFYSLVPRAANGRELELDEVRARVADLSAQWDRAGDFGERVRREVRELVDAGHWRSSFGRRLVGLIGHRRRVRRRLARLRDEGRAEGVAEHQLAELTRLAREAARSAVAVSHFEDLRGLLATWRWVHRWFALLMVLLVALHVAVALRFGGLLG